MQSIIPAHGNEYEDESKHAERYYKVPRRVNDIESTKNERQLLAIYLNKTYY